MDVVMYVLVYIAVGVPVAAWAMHRGGRGLSDRCNDAYEIAVGWLVLDLVWPLLVVGSLVDLGGSLRRIIRGIFARGN